MFESLLTYFCGKNSAKKRKIRNIYRTIEFDPETNVYICHSSRFPETIYHIIYSNKMFKHVCSCEAIIYRKYNLYSSPDERNKLRDKTDCIHIIAIKLWKALHNQDNYDSDSSLFCL